MSSPRIYVTADVMTHEAMRFALREIVRRFADDPYSFTAQDAAGIAEAALASVTESEQREVPHA
jgi:hypothetical protein